MKVAISINEVLRDFLGHLTYAINGIKGVDCNVKEGDVKEFDLLKYFPFESKQEMYHMFYVENSIEIFASADQLTDNIMSKLNIFNMDLIDEENDVELEIVSREVGRSKPATLFFLSKLECEISKIRFVQEYEDKWDGVDVLITANPTALKAKPEGKTSVKVKASYNTDVIADFEIDSLEQLIEDQDLRNRILNHNSVLNN